jgi:hypothetical protein
MVDHSQAGARTLSEVDSEIFALLNKEKDRQRRCLELIASEVSDFLMFFFFYYLFGVFLPFV